MNSMRVWADISLENIVHNFREIKRTVGEDTRVMAVVKADAYGHGATAVSRALEEAGADYFAVASLQEAIKLRSAGIQTPIMVLGCTSPSQTGELLHYSITQTVFCSETAHEFSQAALRLGGKLKVHIKVDTGMSRLGFVASNPKELELAAEVCALTGLEVEGIFTHFATSEIPGDPFQIEQLKLFDCFCNSLLSRGVHIPIKHSANSGAIINIPESHMDMVRPGLALYGLYPGKNLEDKINLKAAMQLHSQVAQVHNFSGPVTVSYGRKYSSESEIKTATVTMGYADGLFRTLSGKMEMLVRGRRVPQIGSICMDMSVIDVSAVPDVKEGDPVTLIGRDGDESICAEELADYAGTVSYEIVCALSGRVDRRYVNF
ncbi:MAG: alanine racemase [Clostridiales bacterium]|nr:alanine racemase [Clostridiales bacterium]